MTEKEFETLSAGTVLSTGLTFDGLETQKRGDEVIEKWLLHDNISTGQFWIEGRDEAKKLLLKHNIVQDWDLKNLELEEEKKKLEKELSDLKMKYEGLSTCDKAHMAEIDRLHSDIDILKAELKKAKRYEIAFNNFSIIAGHHARVLEKSTMEALDFVNKED